jgi:signal transduction histidine kinase
MGSYGLGLAIVKAIMEMHGERYGVSNVDDGVEFWFELTNVEMDLETEDF